MWTTKIGNTAKHLRLGLTDADGALVTFASLTGPDGSSAPQLRLRRPHEAQDTALSFDVTAYVDPSAVPQYNAEVIFADFTGITPGRYYAEVDGQLAGEPISFPGGGYIELQFLDSLEAPA